MQTTQQATSAALTPAEHAALRDGADTIIAASHPGTAWAYRPPHRPANYPSQCYYRAGAWNHIAADGGHHDIPDTRITLFRHAPEATARLTLESDAAMHRCTISVAQMTALRNALNDALQDIAELEAERERANSFAEIQEELFMLEDDKATVCYYAHPDVHYVAPDQVAAKVRELEAAGAHRYLVLPDPASAEVPA